MKAYIDGWDTGLLIIIFNSLLICFIQDLQKKTYAHEIMIKRIREIIRNNKS